MTYDLRSMMTKGPGFAHKLTSRKDREGRKECGQFCDKAAPPGFRKAVDDSLNSILEPDFAKIDQQTKTPVAQAKLREQLLAVNRDELFHSQFKSSRASRRGIKRVRKNLVQQTLRPPRPLREA